MGGNATEGMADDKKIIGFSGKKFSISNAQKGGEAAVSQASARSFWVSRLICVFSASKACSCQES
jgi:hypothetical protein